MWSYRIPTGLISENGVPRHEVSYSGFGPGLNNASACTEHGVGPIPPGTYRIGPGYDDPDGLGVLVMHLDPLPGTNTFQRALFRIHGDNSKQDHSASRGCIVAPHSLRLAIDASRDRILEVIA